MKKDDTFEGTTQDLARLLGITPRTVQKLTRKGIFKRISRGVYDLGTCARAYFEYERAQEVPITAVLPNSPVEFIKKVKVSAAELGEILEITARWVQKLASRGVFVKDADGERYSFLEALRSYHEYLRNNSRSNQDDIDIETLRLTRAKADKAEIAVEILKGETAKIETVMQIWGDLITIFRSRMLGMPNKLASTLAHIDDPAEIQALVMEEVRDALGELAAVNTDDLVEKALQDDLEDDSSTSEPDGITVG